MIKLPPVPTQPLVAPSMPKNSKDTANELCLKLYESLEPFGFYPALTGGVLYKTGNRKDIDIVIYRNRQKAPLFEMSDLEGLLKKAGLENFEFYGFVTKAKYGAVNVDLFNPETSNDDDYEVEND